MAAHDAAPAVAPLAMLWDHRYLIREGGHALVMFRNWSHAIDGCLFFKINNYNLENYVENI